MSQCQFVSLLELSVQRAWLYKIIITSSLVGFVSYGSNTNSILYAAPSPYVPSLLFSSQLSCETIDFVRFLSLSLLSLNSTGVSSGVMV